MMIKKRKGNVMIAFILITTLAVVAFSLYFILGGRMRGATGQTNYIKALYVAEAGIHKAIWLCTTPPSEGGKGISWRTLGSTEAFGDGSFTIVVGDDPPNNVLITSSGEVQGVTRTIQISLTADSLPVAFDYALFNYGDLEVKSSVTVNGDVFANGDALINNPAVIDGEVVVPEDNSVSGTGDYDVGEPLEDPPPMPYIDPSWYNGHISIASAQAPGDVVLEDYDLGDSTVYVNGNVTIRGNLTGGGKVVASGDILFEDTDTGEDITYISGDQMYIGGNSNIGDSLIYSSNDMEIAGTARITGMIIAPLINVSGTPTIFGSVFATDISVTLGTVNIVGNLINPASNVYEGDISIFYDPAYLPDTPPPGMMGGGYSIVPGSWREL